MVYGSGGPRGTYTCAFEGRLETACSGIKLCVRVEGKGLDGGVTSICIRRVGCERACFWRGTNICVVLA